MDTPPTLGILELNETIAQLGSLDNKASFWRRPRWRVFGAKRHQYKSLPPLTETELSRFEAVHSIALPEDYRLFLREICNGRVGPSYGLATLEEASQCGNLNEPFLLTQASNLYTDEELSELHFEDGTPGLLQLSHHGCGMYSYLVVNGPTYGTMWYDNGDFYPTGQNFMGWYKDWAETQLRQLMNEPLVEKLRVGMTVAQVNEITHAQWEKRFAPDSAGVPSSHFLVSADFRAQLKLDKNGIVQHIKRF